MPLSIHAFCLSMAVLSFALPAQGSVPPAPAEQEKINESSDKPAQGVMPAMSIDAMDTKAQTYVRGLAKTTAVSAQKKEEIAKRRASEGPAEIQTLDEIKVRDRLDPEDYVAPKNPPMLAFRAKLDRQRPMTPQEITKLALCFISLCAIDTSKELKLDDRNEARAKDPPSFIFR